MPSPRQILLPKTVCCISSVEVRQSNPISNTVKAIKNECTCIIWRFMMLKEASSSFHLKYLGKITWMNERATKRIPIILRCKSILDLTLEDRKKRGEFYFANG